MKAVFAEQLLLSPSECLRIPTASAMRPWVDVKHDLIAQA